MSYKPVTIERFGGLNLSSDSGDFGFNSASDLLNVEIMPNGSVRTRPGWAKWNDTTGAAAYQTLGYGNGQVLAGSTSKLDVFDYNGTRLFSNALTGDYKDFVAFGTASATRTYVTRGSTAAIQRWDGAALTAPAGMPTAHSICVQSPDNRLVAGAISGTSLHRVKFSNAGDAETWSTNDYVDITPGDNEWVTKVVAWRNLVFAFKHTKFAVFYGNSTDSTGATQFNYQMVTGETPGNGVNPSSVVVADDGVYFINERGVWRTTGGQPECVSSQVQSLFAAPLPTTSPFRSAGTHVGYRYGAAYQNGRLYFSILGTTNTYTDRILVFDKRNGWWSVYSANAGPMLGMATFIGTGGLPGYDPDCFLLFAYSTGTNDIGRFAGYSTTTDNGSAIVSSYTSGFSDLGVPQDKVIREMQVTGTGTITASLLTDYSTTAVGSGSLALGSSVSEKPMRNSARGRQFAFTLSASAGAWEAERVTLNVREAKSSGTDS